MRVMSLVVAVAVFGFVTPSSARADEPLQSDRPVQAKLTPCPQTTELTAAAPTPLAKRWYVWAAVGVIVATAVVASVAVAQRSAPKLSTADVCGNGRACDGCIGLNCSAP